ncbi:hypothetical protein BH09BAC2_BH09BAC2_16760 [soil metagenome]
MKELVDLTLQLNEYLSVHHNFDDTNSTGINENVYAVWDARYRKIISEKLQDCFQNIKVSIVSSTFEIEHENVKDAIVFLHHANITDPTNGELLSVYIKTLVNFNKTIIYPDAPFASLKRWKGRSKSINSLFKKLKKKDKHLPYMHPITLAEVCL